MYDHEAVKDLQWVGNDIEGAKKLLDDAGIVDTDGDGWREYNGEKLSYVATCPNGWSDWQAAIEVVAAAGKKIGIDITTNFPNGPSTRRLSPSPMHRCPRAMRSSCSIPTAPARPSLGDASASSSAPSS